MARNEVKNWNNKGKQNSVVGVIKRGGSAKEERPNEKQFTYI